MYHYFTWLLFIQSLPFVFAAGLVLILWKRRHVEGVKCLILFECATAMWSIADTLEHGSATLDLKILYSQFAILGASVIPPSFLLFTLGYFRNEKFTRKRILYTLFIIPAITFSLSLTNRFHHLIWTNVELTGGNGSIYYYGNWFWFYVFYELGISVLAVSILLSSTIKFYKIYKRQIIYLIVASILPFTSCVLYIFKLTPLNSDLTPLSLTLVGIFVAVGIYRQGMLDVIPIARKQIIHNLSDGILVIDMADRIIDANSAVFSIVDERQEQLIGKSFEPIKEKIFPPSFTISNKQSNFEIIIKMRKELKYFDVTYNPVKLHNEKLIGKIFIFHDITARKKALNSAMEANTLLHQEIKEKEKLILDLDAYACSVAHDLKNPITGLLGITEMLKEDVLNDKKGEAIELLDLVHDQSKKMYKIIDELLLMSRIRKEDVLLSVIDMPAIIDESLKRLNGIVGKKPVSIDLPQVWPSVLGHAQWIEEVWYNLLSNAIKYGGNPPTIRIGYEAIDPTTCKFWIQDNGKGLPAESLEKVFNDFERLNNKKEKGHGLGLSIVKRIVEKMGGEVDMVSENIDGKGCVFSFTLKTTSESEIRK